MVTTAWIRFVLSLALVIAAIPVRASEPSCAPTAPAIAKCQMACCAKGPMRGMACPKAAVHPSKSSCGSCRCEMTKATDVPLQGTPPAITVLPVFTLTETSVAIIQVVLIEGLLDAGLVGTDAGPPPNTFLDKPTGLAPPAP